MIIRLKLFAAAKQAMSLDEVALTLSEGASVADLRVAIVEQHPQLESWTRHAMFSVDTEYVGNEFVIPSGAEVAMIPPVSGG